MQCVQFSLGHALSVLSGFDQIGDLVFRYLPLTLSCCVFFGEIQQFFLIFFTIDSYIGHFMFLSLKVSKALMKLPWREKADYFNARLRNVGRVLATRLPEPVFTGEFKIDEQRTVGENHLKLKVRPASGGNALDAIAFNQAGPGFRGVVQMTYRLDVNEFRGFETPQLIVEQIVAMDAPR